MDLEIDICSNELNDNWVLSRRLVMNGTQESLDKLEKMDNAEMVDFEEEEG